LECERAAALQGPFQVASGPAFRPIVTLRV
jgi:hypothetical protein